MKEMQAFARQYEELAKKAEKIEEIGCIELTELKNDLATLQSKMRLGGEELSEGIAHNAYDLDDFAEGINLWRTTDKKIDDLIFRINLSHNNRWEFTQSKFSEYRVLKEYRRENQKRINEFKFELDKHNALLNHISDPFARDNMEETIRDDEKHIQRAEELGEKYDSELANLAKTIDKLLHGGKMPEKDQVDVEDILDELEKDDFKVEASKAKKEEEPKKEKEIDLIPIHKIKKIAVSREEEKPALEAIDTTEEELEEKEVAPLINPMEEEPKTRALPPRFDEKIEEPEIEEPEEKVEEKDDDFPYEDLDEEVTPVSAMVVQPKAPLWKKIGKVVAAGIAFLAALGTTVHTGLTAKGTKHVEVDTNKEETVEETESEVSKEAGEVKNPRSTKTDEDVKKETPVKKEESVKKEEPVRTEEPAKTEEPTKTEEPVKEEETEMKLAPGEVIKDTNTGVAVDYEGHAVYEDEKGNLEPLEDRELEHDEKGLANVKDEDLEKGPTLGVPVTYENERTGQEISEEEAKANMNDKEREVADSQEDDWFNKMLEETNKETGRSR